MKKICLIIFILLSFIAAAHAQDVYQVKIDTTLTDVPKNMDSNGKANQVFANTPDVVLSAGQYVWISDSDAGMATVHFLVNLESGTMRYGKMPVKDLELVIDCEVSDILSNGSCQ